MNERETAASIAALAAPEPSARARAARALYDAGCARALTATAAWRLDAGFAACLLGPLTVGIAVAPHTFDRIRAACASPPLADVPPDQEVREFQLHFDSGVSLDVLTTTRPQGHSPLARFLDRHGEAVQQVEMPVSDVDRATSLIRQRFALEPVYPETRPGADATRVNFFLVPEPGAGKLLIELVEPARDPPDLRLPEPGAQCP